MLTLGRCRISPPILSLIYGPSPLLRFPILFASTRISTRTRNPPSMIFKWL